MILSNLTAHPAPCNTILDMKIPVVADSSIPGGFYPTNSRCATSPTPPLPAKPATQEVPALPLLLDAFVQGASEDPDASTKRKAPLHFLASVFANLSTVSASLLAIPSKPPVLTRSCSFLGTSRKTFLPDSYPSTAARCVQSLGVSSL